MSPPPLNSWLDTLRAVAPMQGALLVGAGTGAGPLVQWLLHAPPAPAWLVEADKSQFECLQRNLPARPGWSARCEIVTPDSQPVHFHRSSIPAEGSLLESHGYICHEAQSDDWFCKRDF